MEGTTHTTPGFDQSATRNLTSHSTPRQIKHLRQDQRKALARIIVALADGRRDEVMNLFVKMGFRSKVGAASNANKDGVRRLCTHRLVLFLSRAFIHALLLHARPPFLYSAWTRR